MNDGLDEYDLALLKAAGLRPTRICGECSRGYVEGSRAHCGASPDMTPTPIWAENKYSMAGLLHMLAGKPLPNSDCEDLDPSIAEQCSAYEQKG